MDFDLENLKKKSQQLREETRQKSINADRIGELFVGTFTVLDAESRKIRRRNFMMSFISCIISITALILSIFKSDDISVDAANLLGVIVAILAFLITLLLGFQIYKAIEVEDTIDRRMSDIESKISDSLKTFVNIRIHAELNNKKEDESPN